MKSGGLSAVHPTRHSGVALHGEYVVEKRRERIGYGDMIYAKHSVCRYESRMPSGGTTSVVVCCVTRCGTTSEYRAQHVGSVLA